MNNDENILIMVLMIGTLAIIFIVYDNKLSKKDKKVKVIVNNDDMYSDIVDEPLGTEFTNPVLENPVLPELPQPNNLNYMYDTTYWNDMFPYPKQKLNLYNYYDEYPLYDYVKRPIYSYDPSVNFHTKKIVKGQMVQGFGELSNDLLDDETCKKLYIINPELLDKQTYDKLRMQEKNRRRQSFKEL